MTDQYLNDAALEIQHFLSRLADGEPDWHFHSVVLKHGRFWTPCPRPKGLSQGTPRQCFANAFALLHAFERQEPGRYRYAEGWAASSNALNLPIHHAWLVDEQGRVLDWTWDYHDGTAYFGFSFATDFVLGRPEKDWGAPLLDDADVHRAHFANPVRRRKGPGVVIEQLANREEIKVDAVAA